MIHYVHTDFDATIQLVQLENGNFKVTLSTKLDGQCRNEPFNDLKAAIRCYLGMIADEMDLLVPNKISPMVIR